MNNVKIICPQCGKEQSYFSINVGQFKNYGLCTYFVCSYGCGHEQYLAPIIIKVDDK